MKSKQANKKPPQYSECNKNQLLIYHIQFKETQEVPTLVNFLGNIILST